MDGSVAEVMIVDDNVSYRQMLKAFLRTCPGLVVIAEATDGSDAIEQLRHCLPDSILLDLQMPGLSGFDAVPELRALAPNACIVVNSGCDDPETVERALARGACAFLSKTRPLSTIAEYLGHPHAGHASGACLAAAGTSATLPNRT